jgi:glycerophosphoryl diester phosphodiesterase
LDALDQGFCSVEADIYAIDGKLLVAHDRSKVRPDRTLQALYLDPLRERVRANRGRVYPSGPEFFLLIDFKTAADTTWTVLRPVLDEYAEMLTTFTTDRTQTNAVTIVISGSSPRAALATESPRRAAIDGRQADLDGEVSPHLVPWISENWLPLFSWRGQGEMPAQEKARLDDFVRRAHAQGRRLRFWGAPDIEPIWRAQNDAGVDFINTDKLAELRRFLK